MCHSALHLLVDANGRKLRRCNEAGAASQLLLAGLLTKDYALGSSVEGAGQGTEALLARSVPNGTLDLHVAAAAAVTNRATWGSAMG
jgi:hypothetical protein